MKSVGVLQEAGKGSHCPEHKDGKEREDMRCCRQVPAEAGFIGTVSLDCATGRFLAHERCDLIQPHAVAAGPLG